MLTLGEPVSWSYANLCTFIFQTHTLLEFTELSCSQATFFLFFFSYLGVDSTPTLSDICYFKEANAEDTNKRGKSLSRTDSYIQSPF